MNDSSNNSAKKSETEEKMKQLADSTLPPDFSGLLTSIDASLASAKETINASLSQSSSLLRRSMHALTATSLDATENSAAVDKSKQDALGAVRTKTITAPKEEGAPSKDSEQASSSINEQVGMQNTAEQEMIKVLKSTEVAIAEGIKAQHQAQIKMQQAFQSQFENSISNTAVKN